MKKYGLLLFINLTWFATSSAIDYSRLNSAILNDSAQEIKAALEGDGQANIDNRNHLPLLKAILLRKSNAVKILLDCGANPNITYMDMPVIHWAIKNRELEIALHLINARVDFSGIIDKEQDIFTYISTHFDDCIPGKTIQLDLLNALVVHEYNIEANFQNKNLLNNAWYIAIANNQSKLIGYFLGYEKNDLTNPYVNLKVANPNQIFALPDGSSWTALMKAVERYGQNGNIPGGAIFIINKLLEAGVNINQQIQINDNIFHSPLSLALTKNDSDLIRTLIEKGANVSEAIMLFIRNGGDKNCILKTSGEGYWTLLGLAIYYQDIDGIKFLIKEKIDINQVIDPYPILTDRGNIQHFKRNRDFFSTLRGPHTPLFYALHENKNVADYLIENGAHT
jgi:hypothetical protein